VIDCVVSPFDQVFPEALDDIKVTDPPEQKVVDPPADMVGVLGAALTVTTIGLDVAEQFPLATVTV
jgi:hypothetical protein